MNCKTKKNINTILKWVMLYKYGKPIKFDGFCNLNKNLFPKGSNSGTFNEILKI